MLKSLLFVSLMISSSMFAMNAQVGDREWHNGKEYTIVCRYEFKESISIVMERVTEKICGMPYRVEKVQTDHFAGQDGWVSFCTTQSDYSRQVKAIAIGTLLVPSTILLALKY